MVYMGNAVRSGSFRAKIEKTRTEKGLYSAPETDVQYAVGDRLLKLGLDNLRMIQNRQAESAVIRDEKFDPARDLGQGVPSIIQSILMGATMGPMAAGTAIGTQMLGSKTEQMLESPEKLEKKTLGFGWSGADKLTMAPLMAAIVEGGVEMTTLGKFLTATGPFIKRTIKQSVIEGMQEGIQSAGEFVGDVTFGTRDIKETPDALVETVYSFALGAVLGGTAATGFNIANRNATIDQLTEITGDRKRATVLADKMLEGAVDDVTSILETESGMKQAHGEIYNKVYASAYDAVEKSGAMASMSEDEKAQAVKLAAKSFADQVVTESFYRNVPVSEILQGTDISVNSEGNIVILGKGQDVSRETLMQSEKRPEDFATAEEYVASKGKPVYHGSDVLVDKYDINRPAKYIGFGQENDTGLSRGYAYFSDKKKFAKEFGKVINEAYISKEAKIFNPGRASEQELVDIFGKQGATQIGETGGIYNQVIDIVENPERAGAIRDKLKKLGYDGIYVDEGEQGVSVIRSIAILNPDVIQTKSQLTAEWQKAKASQGTRPEDFKTAEEYVASKPVVYHVVDSDAVPSIMKEGVIPNKGGMAKNVAGGTLSEKGKVYTFENFDDAARWAFKNEFGKGKKQTILQVNENPSTYEQDTHFESGGSKGRWLKKQGGIDYRNIIDSVELTPEMKKRLVLNSENDAKGGLTWMEAKPESQLTAEFNAAKGKVLEQGGDQPRASITFLRNARVIKLTQTSDATALPHEFAHLWLDDMWQFVKSGRASKAYMNRWNNISTFLGISEGQDTITVEQQEKFARAYEAYLFNGNAPSVQLADEFAAYRKWMRSVYSDIKNLDVQITPQAERFFDSMMVIDKAYIENRVKFGTRKRPNRIGRDTSEFVDKLFVPLSTRLDKVNTKLKHVLRKHIFDVNMANKKDIEAVRPFIEKMSKLSEDDYKDLDLALKNGDPIVAEEIADRNGIRAEYDAMRKVIDDIYTKAKDAGMDVGFIEDYFPRRIQDTEDYLDFLRGGNNWTTISKTIRNEERAAGRPLSEDEKAHIADMAIRGYGEDKINAGKPSNVKERKIVSLTADQNTFYKPSPTALLEYISGMNDKIEASKFLGNGKNFDESIGAYVNNLIESGLINAKQEKEVQRVFKSYFGKRGTSGLISGYKNFSYIYTMGSPISAITQLGDFAFGLYKNGYFSTLKSVLTKGKLTKQDIGIDNIITEFQDSSKSGNAVSAVFKAVGLEGMDAMGKSVIIDGAFKRLSRQAKSGQLNLDQIFGTEAPQVIQDLIDMNPTENVKYLLFSELADVQPIALSELPEGYVSGGNARLFYMLKSYTIKQLDLYHNEVFRQIQKNPVKGFSNLLRLTFALMLMGMTADGLKDLLLGRPITITDLMVDNILKTVGFSKYTIYKAKREGALTASMQMMNPPIPFFDDMIKDIGNQFKDEPPETKDLRIWNALPVVGKFYYWWFGGGRTYLEERSQ